MQPIISTVIPTRNRPLIVERAVKSALAQTFTEIEVIVVIDGSDACTREVLEEIDDSRLKVIELPVRGGAAAARNAGVSAAVGEWIAFLDDDDEWFPQKLERQIEVAKGSQYELPIVASRLTARSPKGDYIRPRRFLSLSEPISEYLLARNSLFQGEGLIQTSVLLTKKQLLQQVPFRTDLLRHQDWDWLLRASNLAGIGIEFVSEPLAIWYVDEKRNTVSTTSNWRNSLAWIQENKNLVTPRAYSAFIMVEVGAQAAQERAWQEFLPLLSEAILGKPQLIDFLLYFGLWLIPQETRRSIRALLTKQSSSIKSA
ncbi:glycosyltransferase family 2 protein [Aliterella atlantica]|uniref:Glycosyl transferase n=1 Tax=Aliterella atlantica CENA595 TaxID=1618023 RepID=A0A0D8ZZB1_9CYAN|nr:glycosyltransferase [Aliterella atlantica]KJH72561.1 glycosyl transferase [Aliterella atlantica CENA595]